MNESPASVRLPLVLSSLSLSLLSVFFASLGGGRGERRGRGSIGGSRSLSLVLYLCLDGRILAAARWRRRRGSEGAGEGAMNEKASVSKELNARHKKVRHPLPESRSEISLLFPF